MINGGLRTKGITKAGTTEHPLITVVTVVFNGEKTLEQTIQSVVNQTYDNIEYIIIDGNSTDKTLDVIKKYEDKIDYWQSEPDKGIYDAMNKGIDLARGDYIALLNSGDWYDDNSLQSVVEVMIEDNFRNNIYYGGVRIVNEKSETMELFCTNICQISQKSIAHPACFISKSVYEKYKYDTSLKSAADYDFFCNIHNKERFFFIEKILANYLFGGMSNSNVGKIETVKIKCKYGWISSLKKALYIIYYSLLGR